MLGYRAQQTWHCAYIVLLLSAIEALKKRTATPEYRKQSFFNDTGAPATDDCRLMSSRLQAKSF